jgi:hypothetical protein
MMLLLRSWIIRNAPINWQHHTNTSTVALMAAKAFCVTQQQRTHQLITHAEGAVAAAVVQAVDTRAAERHLHM